MEKGKVLLAYRPGRDFIPVSVTGHACGLGCDHCRGIRLKGMVASSPLSLAEDVRSRNASGVMVSGGCDSDGRLDFEPCSASLRRLTDEGVTVAVHAVLPTEDDCRMLASCGIEAICLDMHADPRIISEVLHLRAEPVDYLQSLIAVKESGARAFPHVTVGLSAQDCNASLDAIAEAGVKEVAILGLMSTPGTPLEGSEASEEEIVDAFEYAISIGLNPTLGCMRPRNRPGLEMRLLEMGVRSFASPSREFLSKAMGQGFTVQERRSCCCITRTWRHARNGTSSV